MIPKSLVYFSRCLVGSTVEAWNNYGGNIENLLRFWRGWSFKIHLPTKHSLSSIFYVGLRQRVTTQDIALLLLLLLQMQILQWRYRANATGALYNSYRVTVRLNSKQYDGSSDRPQTSGGQVGFRWNCGEKSVFSSRRKVSRDGALRTDAGSSLHVLAAATGKARSPRVCREDDEKLKTIVVVYFTQL